MSTEHQQYSTENQADKIREYAARRNIEIVRTYADEGKSGLRIDGREALQRLIRDVAHRTVEEIWYVIAGRGEMWRKAGEYEETVVLEPGVCLTIPRGTHFQFRALADDGISAIGITMPPWPGSDEAYEVEGPWSAC